MLLVWQGEDAGGLRRQFFDRFTSELKVSGLWMQTPAGSLRPVDVAAVQAASSADAAAHMVTCGRVCGMALYQELHRRLGAQAYPELYAKQPPNLFGDAFARCPSSHPRGRVRAHMPSRGARVVRCLVLRAICP